MKVILILRFLLRMLSRHVGYLIYNNRPGGVECPLPVPNQNKDAMKLFSLRILLNSAAALSLLVSASSCIKVTPDSGDQAEHYIGFTSSVETKAPVDTDGQIDRFAVWAYRSEDAGRRHASGSGDERYRSLPQRHRMGL